MNYSHVSGKNNDSYCKTVEQHNAETVHKLVGPIVFFCFLLLVGLLGNVSIVIVFKDYGANVYKRIIWTIGVVDLTFCVIGIPFNISRLALYYTFTSATLCRILCSLLDFGIMASTHLLLLLTVFRYLQVCYPLKRYITTFNVTYYIAGCFVVGLCHGIIQFSVQQPLSETKFDCDEIGRSCTVAWKSPPLAWKGYNTFLLSLYLAYTFIIFVLYALMARKMFALARRRLTELNVSSSASATVSQELSTKITLIAFVICIVFAISYLPLFLNEVIDDLKPHPNTDSFGILIVITRSYLINHVANAIIYYIIDQSFRDKMQCLFRGSRCCGVDEKETNNDQ